MSDSLPDPDDEIVVKLSEEASLDDLIAGLEATWQGTRRSESAGGTSIRTASGRTASSPCSRATN